MAILTANELVAIRRQCAAERATVNYTKAQINAALQAIEDFFEASRASLGAAIETAAPGKFNVAEKRQLVKFWLAHKFGAGG